MARTAEYAQAFAGQHYRPLPRRLGVPETIAYVWRRDWQQPAWVLEAIRAARETAREKIRGELRAGAWWIPPGFTEQELDQLEPEGWVAP